MFERTYCMCVWDCVCVYVLCVCVCVLCVCVCVCVLCVCVYVCINDVYARQREVSESRNGACAYIGLWNPCVKPANTHTHNTHGAYTHHTHGLTHNTHGAYTHHTHGHTHNTHGAYPQQHTHAPVHRVSCEYH